LSPLVAAALLWTLKELVDEVFVGGHLDELPSFIGVYVVLIACKLLLDYSNEVLEASIVEQVIRDIRVALYRHILSLSPGSLARYSHAALLTHLSGDVERTEYLIYTGPVTIFSNAISTIFFLYFLLLLSWKLTLCAALVVPVLVLLSLLLTPRIRRSARVAR